MVFLPWVGLRPAIVAAEGDDDEFGRRLGVSGEGPFDEGEVVWETGEGDEWGEYCDEA